MDLLCTENIMHDPETEILTKQHLQHATNQHKQHYTYATETTTTKATTAATSAQPTPRNSPTTNSNNSTSNTPLNANHTNNYYNNNSNNKSNNNVTNNNANNHRCSITETSSNTNSKTSATHDHASNTTADRNATHYIFENQPQTAATTNLQQYQQQQQQHNVYTTNLINRSLDFVNTATLDPTFLTDRCLENALKAEEKRPQPVCTYFKTIQKDITPPMRKIVAEWMMELCAEVKCQGEVVLLAISYMDRFLLTKSVRKTHLQILASACLLLASKLREPSCRALSAELLVFYTDNSIYKSDLIKWELFVLSRLGWDLSTVTPLDFLELLLIRLPIRSKECPDLDIDKVRQHAQAFISLAAKEHHFSKYSASTIAASSIAAALSGLNWDLRTGHNLRYLLNRLTDLTSVDQEYLHACMIKMETIFEEHSRNLQPYLVSVDGQHQQLLQQQAQQQQQQHQHNSNKQQQQQQQQSHMQHSNCGVNSLNPNNNNHNHNNIAAAAAAGMLPDLTQTCKMQANSQKDIQDIKF